MISPVNSGGTVVLVSQDGIQRPPLHFPKGGHLLQFLTCLETGLLPHGQLDPPLWNQRGKVRKMSKCLSKFQKKACLASWYLRRLSAFTGKGFSQTAKEEPT